LQALILAGGKGTRLRPLTSDTPKPVVTLVDQPFIGYMLEWLHRHGVDDAVISCGYLADKLKEVLGNGEQYGVSLRFIEEPHPLGTGGALKYAEDMLEDRFFMLNGDLLTDIDLTALREHHEQVGAVGTIALIGVKDPSAFGLVRQNDDSSVSEFLEKPGPETLIDTNLVNAGAYILEKKILADMAPAGTNISIERDVFPTLVGNGLYGFEVAGYWMDIGTPGRYLQGTFDILNSHVSTAIGAKVAAAGLKLVGDATVHGRVSGPALVHDGVTIGPKAIVGGLVVLGSDVEVGAGTRIADSVIHAGAKIGDNCEITDAIVCAGAEIGDNCRLTDGVMVGAGVKIGADNVLKAGMRVFPGVEFPDGAVKF
jgi:mannose-1-phosphate guanylyltransferase